MAYTFQTFVFKNVLTAAQMNQVEVNVRDHVHGTAGVVTVPDTGLSANVALKNIDNAFTSIQAIRVASASLTIDALTGTPLLEFHTAGLLKSRMRSSVVNNLELDDSTGNIRVTFAMAPTGDTSMALNASTGTPLLQFQRNGVLTSRIRSSAVDRLEIDDSTGNIRVTWDLSTNPGTLILGNIPDARLTANIPLLNAATNVFTGQLKIQGGAPGLNKVLTSDALGLATWEVNPSAPFVVGGEAGGANRTLGNTDAFDLGFETSNINRLNITAAGDISIIGNITQDLTIKKATAASIIDATTGDPKLIFKRDGVTSVSLESFGSNSLAFVDSGGNPSIQFLVSGFNVGKMAQGIIPLARLEGRQEKVFILDFGSVAAHSGAALTVSVIGAALGDFVLLSNDAQNFETQIIYKAKVTTPGNVTVYALNISTVTINPISDTFNIKVISKGTV